MKTFKSYFAGREKIIYLTILFLFSISVNQYYGNLGICPIDSFWFFNSGYDILNGYYPFKDYWTITGPFIGFTQAIIFKLLGVSWSSYVFHASIYNFLISIFTFHTLRKFKLNIHHSFIYAFLVAIIAYPSAGTPYVDHHASILSVISLFCFILALKTNDKIYWILLPIILFLAFITKQVPSAYILILIIFLLLIYFMFNFSINKIIYILSGSAIIILFFLLTLFIGKISFLSFIEQYIFFTMSIGEDRFSNFLFPFEFSRFFLRHKLIHISSIILFIIIIKNTLQNPKFIKNIDFLILLSFLVFSYSFIAHQLMTINGMFIFFIIPILTAFSHIYYLKYFSPKKYVINFLSLLAIISTFYYGYKYIDKRDFMDLRNADKNNYVDAGIVDKKLNGLKWISCLHPDNPQEEISELKQVIQIIKNDERKKSIITDYQFISVILSSYDFSPNQVWFINNALYKKSEIKIFKKYKDFFVNHFKNNKIQVVYTIKPLWGGDDIFEKALDSDCYTKNNITKILDVYQIEQCKAFEN